MAKSPETEHPLKAFGWAARDTSGTFSPFKFSRRETGEYDVQFKVLYCGVCHSDLHMVKNEWGFTQYPIVPGRYDVLWFSGSSRGVRSPIWIGFEAAAGTLDGIIDTVSATHPIVPLLSLLKPHGKLVLVGAPEKPLELPAFPLIQGRKIVAGSAIGGIKETQEMVDFAAKHNILPDIELIPIDYINTAMERLLKADVKYRLVIDIANSLKSE
ncbi:8-hydroxygeraniol dehydrogenase [Handroanthus impetiginosus]|uniref:8-hydroxygeraniol dehydrogenase n=1 Tax=Handroanthus impetiginosus TaxID=429701 RepID=A0A2G9G1B1_9LAMI|nr:8-hydroxygeraniol dehydrogenase [Handroanthus impetiginosus]